MNPDKSPTNENPVGPESPGDPAVSQPLTGKALAAHWSVSPPMISKLRKEKGMPPFTSLDAADRWARKNHPKVFKGFQNVTARGSIINIDEIRNSVVGREFEDVMLEQAEEIPLIAYAIYRAAAESGSAYQMKEALDGWNRSSKVAADQRLQWLAVQEKSGGLLDLDTVENIVGQIWQSLRSFLVTMPSAVATDANPGNPELAQSVIEKSVQGLMESTARDIKLLAAQLDSGSGDGQ